MSVTWTKWNVLGLYRLLLGYQERLDNYSDVGSTYFFFSSRRRHTRSVSAFLLEPLFRSYAPSYVSPAYHLLEGFPFIQEPPSGDLQERVLIRHHDYDQCFQSVQLLQWNSQVKFNVT